MNISSLPDYFSWCWQFLLTAWVQRRQFIPQRGFPWFVPLFGYHSLSMTVRFICQCELRCENKHSSTTVVGRAPVIKLWIQKSWHLEIWLKSDTTCRRCASVLLNANVAPVDQLLVRPELKQWLIIPSLSDVVLESNTVCSNGEPINNNSFIWNTALCKMTFANMYVVFVYIYPFEFDTVDMRFSIHCFCMSRHIGSDYIKLYHWTAIYFYIYIPFKSLESLSLFSSQRHWYE